MAMSKDHIYQETEIEVECQGEIFKAKGKIVLQDGWKLFENCFKNKDRMAIVDPDQEMKERMPKVTQGQTFYAVAAEKDRTFYIATKTIQRRYSPCGNGNSWK